MVTAGDKSVDWPEPAFPVAAGFWTAPSPLQKMEMNSLRCAGRVLRPGMLPTGAATMSVLAIRIVPWPLPCEFVENRPGPVAPSVIVAALVATPFTVTTTEACVAPANSQGNWKLIWVGETKNSGAGLPFKVMLTPPREVGSGRETATWMPEARLEPNSEPIEPAAGGCPPKLAPLTMPPELMVGPMTGKISAFEVPPPGEGLNTLTWAVAAVAMSVAGIEAVNCVSLTKVVPRSLPFQRTTDLGTKFAPTTVKARDGPPAIELEGNRASEKNQNGNAFLLELLDKAYDHPSWHGPNLRNSLRGVTARQAAWRPGRGRHNIWEVAVHAAYWKYAVRRRLRGEKRGSFALKGSNWFARPASVTEKAWRADLALLEEERTRTYNPPVNSTSG